MKTEREFFIERFKNTYNMKECNTPFGIKFSYGVTQDAFDVWIASANREGYKLVPVVPTGAMPEALDTGFEADYEGGSFYAKGAYKAMIGAVE